MRKIIILLLIISVKSFGQNTINFVDTNVTWNVANTFPNGNIQNPNFVTTVTKVYGFNGDTLIGNKLWHKIFFTSDSVLLSNPTYLGNLREENGLVLFMDTSNTIDTIYNFNLLVGDSVKYNFGFSSKYIYISIIDSININGNYYKRFHFIEPNFPPLYLKELWIEGIGSIHGPLFPSNPTLFETEIPDSMYLTCYKNNDLIIWSNPYYNDCYINIVLSLNNFQQKLDDVFLFPNPVTNELRIEWLQNTNENFVISIFDFDGKIIMKKFDNKNGKIIVDTKTLKDNFYIIQLESENRIFKAKFIKQ